MNLKRKAEKGGNNGQAWWSCMIMWGWNDIADEHERRVVHLLSQNRAAHHALLWRFTGFGLFVAWHERGLTWAVGWIIWFQKRRNSLPGVSFEAHQRIGWLPCPWSCISWYSLKCCPFHVVGKDSFLEVSWCISWFRWRRKKHLELSELLTCRSSPKEGYFEVECYLKIRFLAFFLKIFLLSSCCRAVVLKV